MPRKLENTPNVRLGVVAVSRDCFPAALSRRRQEVLMKALRQAGVQAYRCKVVIENEGHALAALDELAAAGCNAAVVYLGNFGPEGPTTMFIQRFHGPAMVVAAAEEDRGVLAKDRGDALCGILNCSYNLNLRKLRAYIPQLPVGLPDELVPKIALFESIARVVIGVRRLKIITFGPRPFDFLACNAPIQPFYDLGVEVMENSELDLLRLFKDAASQKARLRAVERSIKQELGERVNYPDLLPRLAQLEVALLDFREKNLGGCEYAVFANKCWPAFEFEFRCTPCYVNGRLAARGIPVACETDMYGAMSEWMAQLAGSARATLLDINNSVPADVLPANADLKGARPEDLFMGFHCGNTCADCMKTCEIKYQLIMNRLMEGGKTPDITRSRLRMRITG